MAAPLIVFPDIEQDVCDGLRAFYATRDEDYVEGVEVHTNTVDRAEVLVSVVRAGGVGSWGLDNARLAVACWHRTPAEAYDLTALTLGALKTLRGYRSLRGMRAVSGLVPAPDVDGTPRYLFTVEFTVKPTQLS